jgi:uncharacterized protein (DUF302 family)
MVGLFGVIVGGLLALASVSAARSADAPTIRTLSKSASFDDVWFELNNAILSRGFAIAQNGKINQMLEATGADVGSTKQIYKQAEFFSFCSAKYSRQMMEADSANIAFCPYVVFIYETLADPGRIVVGYRPPLSTTPQSQAALADVDKMLGEIIQEAVK